MTVAGFLSFKHRKCALIIKNLTLAVLKGPRAVLERCVKLIWKINFE